MAIVATVSGHAPEPFTGAIVKSYDPANPSVILAQYIVPNGTLQSFGVHPNQDISVSVYPEIPSS